MFKIKSHPILYLLFCCVLFCCVLANTVRAEHINIAVASNFTLTMKEIVTAFEQHSPHRVHVSYGASGKFFAQIHHGAPFVIFFSADQRRPIALERDGLTVPDSRFSYAQGSLVLWSNKANLFEDGARFLTRGNFRKLALANPKLAPYGIAAVAVLNNLGLKKTSQEKWVKGENIAQTFQFVRTNNADIGFVALSQIRADSQFSRGTSWVIPPELYPPILQDVVLLKKGGNSPAAKEFMRFIRGDRVKTIIQSHGYVTPASPAPSHQHFGFSIES